MEGSLKGSHLEEEAWDYSVTGRTTPELSLPRGTRARNDASFSAQYNRDLPKDSYYCS